MPNYTVYLHGKWFKVRRYIIPLTRLQKPYWKSIINPWPYTAIYDDEIQFDLHCDWDNLYRPPEYQLQNTVKFLQTSSKTLISKVTKWHMLSSTNINKTSRNVKRTNFQMYILTTHQQQTKMNIIRNSSILLPILTNH